MAESRLIARHAGTVLVGQLATMAFGVADTLIAGRYADTALAALSVGAAIYISVFVALMGTVQALLPIWAELHGAGRPAAIGPSVRQALYLCGASMGVGIAVLLAPGPLLQATGVPPALQPEVRHYLAVLAWALPPALLFRLYSTLNQSLGKPRLVTWLQLGALAVKVPLSILLAFGWDGPGPQLQPAGLAGCAWATVAVNYALVGVAMWLLRTSDLYRPYAIWRPLEPPDGRALAAFLRLGLPSGLAILVEVTSFTLMALFIARQGTAALAGHQIAANVAAVLYMLPLSLGIATSARVSYWLGAGDPARARHAAATGLALGIGCALALAGGLLLLRHSVAALYAANPRIALLAGGLLAWVALYHTADAVQAICVFVLRCYRVTVSLLIVYAVLLWGVGLGGGWLLAYRGLGGVDAQWSPAAFWATSAGALALTACIFCTILWRVVKRPAQPPAEPVPL